MNFVRVRRLIAPLIDVAPTLALIVVAGWLAARWLLYFAAPSEPLPQPTHERPQLGAAAQALAGAHLFGVALAGKTVSNLNVKLRGVFAGGGTGTGYAIVNAGGRDEATRIGAEIVSGVTLEAVHAGHIVVRRGGALERVNLEERISAQAPAAAPPRYAQATPPARRSAAPPRRAPRLRRRNLRVPARRSGARSRPRRWATSRANPSRPLPLPPRRPRHRRRGRCRVACRRGW